MKLFGFSLSKNIIPFILLSIIIISIYFNTLNNSFVWDDEYLITNNIFVKSPRYIKNIFTTSLFHFHVLCQMNYYRPLQTISYLFDYHLWKLNPIGYHLTNIFIHVLNAILIYLLIDALFKDKEVALLTSLSFAICPLHVSVVTYIAGRADSMVTFFILSALLLFLKSISVKNDLYYLGSILCFLLALLSKELALIFLPILLLTHKIYETTHRDISKPKDAILRYVPFFLFSLSYIILRMTILNFSDGLPIEHKGNFYLRVLAFFQVALSYIKLIFLPKDLYMHHTIQVVRTILTPFAFLSFICIVFILIAIIRSFRRSNIIFWALSWFLITLSPVCFIMLSPELDAKGLAMMAEHWLYIPLIGFFTAISFVIIISIRLRSVNLRQAILATVVILITAIMVFFYVLQTIRTNADWKDEVSLFSKMVRYIPDDTNIQLALAKSYSNKGNLEEAIKRCKEILSQNKDSDLGYRVHMVLGTAYFKKGNFQEAINEYKNALNKLQETKKVALKASRKFQADNLHNIGIVYFYQRLYPEAENELRQAIQLNPQDATSYSALGVIYAQKSQYGEAIININKSLEINPFNAETYNNLGLVYAHIGNTDKAKEMWQKAIRLNPDFIEARRNIQWVEGINK